MRCLSVKLPTLAADYSGACSALYELGGLFIMHGAGACLGNAVRYDEPRAWDVRSRVFTSGLTDMDCLLGNDERLYDQIVRTHRAVGGAFVAVAGTPNTMIVGTDYDAVADVVGDRCGVPAFGIPTSGTARYNKGAGEALLRLARTVVAPMAEATAGEGSCPKPGARLPRTCNLLGATPLDLRDQASVDGIRELLAAGGWKVASCWAMGSTLEDLACGLAADVNVVVATAGLPLARWMEREYGIPYLEAELSGPKSAARFCERLDALAAGETDGARRPGIGEDAVLEGAQPKETCPSRQSPGPRALVVADRVVALSMRAALLADYGCAEASAATLLPGERPDPARGFLGSLDEEALERELAEGTYDLLVGDGMLAHLLPPGSATRLVNVAWPALSSRLLADPGALPYGNPFAG